MFDLKKFLLDGFKASLEEGSLGEGQVRMSAMTYMMNGILTEADLMTVETIIAEAKKPKKEIEEDNENDEDVLSDEE